MLTHIAPREAYCRYLPFHLVTWLDADSLLSVSNWARSLCRGCVHHYAASRKRGFVLPPPLSADKTLSAVRSSALPALTPLPSVCLRCCCGFWCMACGSSCRWRCLRAAGLCRHAAAAMYRAVASVRHTCTMGLCGVCCSMVAFKQCAIATLPPFTPGSLLRAGVVGETDGSLPAVVRHEQRFCPPSVAPCILPAFLRVVVSLFMPSALFVCLPYYAAAFTIFYRRHLPYCQPYFVAAGVRRLRKVLPHATPHLPAPACLACYLLLHSGLPPLYHHATPPPCLRLPCLTAILRF